MHLQMNYNYTRIRPKIGYSMSEKIYIYQPQNMTYFSNKMHVSMAPGFSRVHRYDGILIDTHLVTMELWMEYCEQISI